ncbi:MAG: hypothetical protein KGM24_09290 [Elusimicrobia bacterium]|nr:hypothetical protein [Elusimicrobiota bacterium]
MPGAADDAATRRLAELLPRARTIPEFMAGVSTEDIETALVGFPDDLSESLVLVAVAIARLEKPGGIVSNVEMSERVDDAATRLGLEWLQRNEALAYEFSSGGSITWWATARYTSEFVAALETRHEVLHRFALGLLMFAHATRN